MMPLGLGRIFWAVYPGDRGDGKRRPMMVASRRVDISTTGLVFAVVCSTRFGDPLRPHEILLPTDPEGRCVTGLREETVAVCDWTTTLPVPEIRETGGLVPASVIREIFARIGIPFVSER